MNVGKNILDLRKEKEITQEELAAELGVTAAAVSKWENGYTLPDIMMLCALADYFGVSTDVLLGRGTQQYTVIVAEDPSLGSKIQQLAARYGILTLGIYPDFQEAVDAILDDEKITHLLVGHYGTTIPKIDFNTFSNDHKGRKLKLFISVSESEADILEELESCLK